MQTEKIILDNKERQINEDFKLTENQGYHKKKNQEGLQTNKTFSIRNITKNKTELDLIELIRSELGIIEDDISIWNKMMFSISQLSIRNRSLNGKRTSFLLSKSIKT